MKKVSGKQFGIVEGVRYPLVKIVGLDGVRVGEMLVFESGKRGQVYQITGDFVVGLVFDKGVIGLGEQVEAVGDQVKIPVLENLVGKVIDPLGRGFYSQKYELSKDADWVRIDRPGLKIDRRLKVRRQFLTGVLLVDLVLPLGMGQRELVLGGRKTGKTSFLKMVVRAYKGKDMVIVYGMIGKKRDEIEAVYRFLQREKIISQSVMVASLASDSPALIYLTPFTAMAVAEFWRDKGKDVMVMLDDLSTHARFYREIALLARKLPGRESYPGDVFFVHARLLERAGNFKVGDKEVSITCFPVAETLGNDIGGFIPTNLMSITDGHLFFDNKLYAEGRRPAINPYLSVTRVGKQTQSSLRRELTLKLLWYLSEYEQARRLSHLSAELPEETRKLLRLGQDLIELFNQYIGVSYKQEDELVLIGLVLLGFEKGYEVKVKRVKERVWELASNGKMQEIRQKVVKCQTVDELLRVLESYKDWFE